MKAPVQLTAALAILVLAACGGSSSGNSPSTPTPTPPAAVKFTSGAITAQAAGSIQVNNLTLSTVGASILVEKVQKPETELKPGMVVKVKAHHDGHTGEALEIEFEDAVKGKVGSVGTSTLSVGGQTVRVDDSTEFEDNLGRLGSIHGNDRVRVSGVPDDRGGLRATRIEKNQAGVADDFELKGMVSALGATGFTLKLSPDAGPSDTYTVNLLGGAALPAGLGNGSFVEVRSLKPVQAGNVIEASSISIEDRLPGLPQSEAEVEGIVTSATGSTQFIVAGISVTTSPSTTWSGGVPDDLVAGVKVEVEGVLGTSGTLAASKVSFRANIRLQGAVSDIAAGTVGTGSFKVNGILIKVDALTDQRVTLASLAAGQLVQVRGTLGRDGISVVATRMESTNDARPILQGVVTAKDSGTHTLTILGKTIGMATASAMGKSDVSGVDGPVMSTDAFFAAIVVGETVVKARGKDATAFADPAFTAKEVSLEGQK
jgi:Domain of unknown function (DUF5666)